VHLEAGELAEADRLSRRAVEEIEARSGWLADAHWVWFQRYRVLEARRRAGDSGSTGLPAEAEADGALRRAYSLLREKSDAFADQELRRTFLENIGLHREINRLHEELQARTRREGARRERSFHEIARSIHSLVELDPLLDRLLELAIETTHAEKGLIVLKDAAGDFITRAARGMLRESVDDAAEICQSVIEDVKRGGKPVLAADAGSDQRFRDRRSIISFHIRTLMCVPLEERGETIGAVYVDGRGASSFDHDDLEYLVAFGQLAAIAVENVKRLERLRAENSDLRRQVEARFRFENLLAESPAMDRVLRTMEKVARTSASVLVSGETGTGKEVVARAIHCASERRARPFVTVDCGALPESLLESELFGHRRGAFSGAIHDRVGLFEEAEGGTLFLDEITNTSLDLQAKLLRALQEREIRRVGENRVQRVDVRVIAATNVDIRKAVADGRFREDLFWRLNVVPIEIPPLRERREDIPLLAAHFLAESARRHGREISGFTEDGLRYLSEAAWRGNVRELENLIEKAVILAEGGRLDGRFLASLAGAAGAAGAEAGAAGERAPAPSPAAVAAGRMSPLPILPEAGLLEAPLSLEEFDRAWLGAERRYLERLVEEVGGNLAAAARRARVRNRNTLISRLRKHGIGRAGGRHGLRAGPPVSEGSAHETSTPGAEA
jgi:transcriptional regulator with GAF, ATPase, and Fis domain